MLENIFSPVLTMCMTIHNIYVLRKDVNFRAVL